MWTGGDDTAIRASNKSHTSSTCKLYSKSNLKYITFYNWTYFTTLVVYCTVYVCLTLQFFFLVWKNMSWEREQWKENSFALGCWRRACWVSFLLLLCIIEVYNGYHLACHFFTTRSQVRWLVDCGCVAIPIFKLHQKSMFAMACLTVGTLCHPSSGKSQLSKLNFIQELGTWTCNWAYVVIPYTLYVWMA